MANFCNQLSQSFSAIEMSELLLPRVGLIHGLVSEANTANFELLSFGTDGKRKTVEATFIPFLDAASGVNGTVGVDTVDICNGSATPYLPAQYEVKYFSSASRNVSIEEMRAYCEGKSEGIDKVIKSLVHSVLYNMDAQLATVFNTVRGNTSAGNTLPLAGSALTPAPVTPLYDVVDVLRSELFNMSHTGTPIVIGGADADKWMRMVNLGCCNQYGQTVEGFAGDILMYPDNVLYSVVPNLWLAFPAGSVQLIEWNANTGIGEFNQGDFLTSTTIEIPVGDRMNMLFDVDVVMSACNKEYTITLSKHYDLAYVPATMFPVGSVQEGSNFMYAIDPA